MLIKEFAEQYCNASQEKKRKLIEGLKIKKYIPINTKKKYIYEALIPNLINNDGGFSTIDPIDRTSSLFVVGVTMYTDLEMDEIYSDYDVLCSTGLIDVLVTECEEDFSIFSKLFDQSCNNLLASLNSIESNFIHFLNNILEKVDFSFDQINSLITNVDFKTMLDLLKK